MLQQKTWTMAAIPDMRLVNNCSRLLWTEMHVLLDNRWDCECAKVRKCAHETYVRFWERKSFFFHAKMEVCIWFELKCIVGGFNCWRSVRFFNCYATIWAQIVPAFPIINNCIERLSFKPALLFICTQTPYPVPPDACHSEDWIIPWIVSFVRDMYEKWQTIHAFAF